MSDSEELHARVKELEAQVGDYKALIERWQVKCQNLRAQNAELLARADKQEAELAAVRAVGKGLLTAVLRSAAAAPRAETGTGRSRKPGRR